MIQTSYGYKIGLILCESDSTKCLLGVKEGSSYCLKVVKILKDDERANKTIKKEINILKKLKNHDNIIKFQESFSISKLLVNKIVIITEMMPMNLRRYWQLKGCILSEEVCKKIIFQVLDAVNFCHNNGVIHQDIKMVKKKK